MKLRLVVFLSALGVSSFASVSILGCSSGNSSSGGTSTTTSTVTPATVASVAPANIAVGTAATTITVTGTNFISTSVVQVAGVSEATTYVSATQLTASVPASLLSSASLLPIAVLNGSTTSATGAAVNLEIDNPAPTIASFSPATFATGSAGATTSVAGSGFVPTSGAQINGSARPTTYVSGTQLSVALTAADLAAPGSLSMKIVNPAPGGGTSSASSIAVNNPAPAGPIILTPSTAIVGAAAATIALSGNGFFSGSVVNVNGSPRVTTFVDAQHLTFVLTATDQIASANLAITVANPAPGGGTTNAVTLVVSPPTPTPVITAISPTQLTISSSPATIQVTGTGLTTKSVVQWNGTSLTTGYGTSYPSNTISLFATVPASMLGTATTASITVVTPTATPSISNALSISVVNPLAPVLTAISPNYGPINQGANITATGTSFTSSSVLYLNGVALPTTFVSSTSLTSAIPASSITLPGNLNVTVSTPAPGGGTSAALPFTAYIPFVSNSMIFNPVNGLFYASVPGSVGAPLGNSVVSIDPETGQIGTPIFVGSEPNKLAVTSDGLSLWVGLDGASAVRKVDLTTNTAGLQFSLGPIGNFIYQYPATALALAALPGFPDSVIVSAPGSAAPQGLSIYDAGVLRPNSSSASNVSAYAIRVDGSRNEIYAATTSGYFTFNYGPSGITALHSYTADTFVSQANDEFQLVAGKIFTDYGNAYDAESGLVLGTFYETGTTPAFGAAVADLTLGKYFVLDNPTTYTFNTTTEQIQIFNTSDYNPTSTSVIPISLGTYLYGASPSRMTRWGVNGLAFRTSLGLFSLRSNLIKDLSSTSADLGVTLTASGTGTTGSNTTYTATISNGGPSAATNLAFSASVPSTGVLISATPSLGTCSGTSTVICDLGGLANGGTTTVTLVVSQLSAGAATLTAHISGSETDPTSANNIATSTSTISGSPTSTVPTLVSVMPATILSGSPDTIITVTGSGFDASSSIVLGTVKLSTTLVSSTSLTATVPAANLATLGWLPVTVLNSASGGGISAPRPLSIYSVITLPANHIIYDPFSRKLMASVASGATTITGNSVVAITPESATVGTPVPIGSQPTKLALTSDGQILYTLLTGNASVARFNMLTQQPDFTVSTASIATNYQAEIATQPGTENTVAIEFGNDSGLLDFNPSTKTATLRSSNGSSILGSCLQFLDSSNLFSVDTADSGAQFYHITVPPSGGPYSYTASNITDLGCFKLSGGLVFGNSGGVANPLVSPAQQLGIYPVARNSVFSGYNAFVPDTSLGHTFYLGDITASAGFLGTINGITAFDQKTFLASGTFPLNISLVENDLSVSGIDLIRWGQDGLAVLTSGGHLYLMRGAFVVPQLLNTNAAATLTASTPGNIAHGSGNTLITVTGSGFIQGAAVTWNGSYRTTTWVDSGHLTVAIPASDLATAGSATLVVTNPGASASSSVTFTIN